MAKKKFYVVLVGENPGIYETWDECKAQVDGFKGAQYKSYKSREEAEGAFGSGNLGTSSKGKTATRAETKKVDYKSHPKILECSICVDGACSGNPGLGEFQCVDVETGEQIFIESGYEDTTNNIMEFLALVEALKWLKERGDERPVYTDSISAMAWVRDRKCKTTLKETNGNFDSRTKIELAEAWLQDNDWETDILKWDTREWGEIPADFGRK